MSSSSSRPPSQRKLSARSARALITTRSGWCRRRRCSSTSARSRRVRRSTLNRACCRSLSVRAAGRCGTRCPCSTSSSPARTVRRSSTNARSPCSATHTALCSTRSSTRLEPGMRRPPFPRSTGSSRPARIPVASSRTCWSGCATSSSSALFRAEIRMAWQRCCAASSRMSSIECPGRQRSSALSSSAGPRMSRTPP